MSDPNLDTILLIDDSKMITDLLSKTITLQLGVRTVQTHDATEARSLIEESSGKIIAVVTNINIKGAQPGEMADFSLGKHIPTVLLTATLNDQTRQQLLNRSAIGYVLKQPQSFDQVINLLRPLLYKKPPKILIVDDNKMGLIMQERLLKAMRLDTVCALNGQEALDTLREHPDVSLVVTDQEMPVMNGLQLVSELRKTHAREDLAIIGVSAVDQKMLSVQFLKQGASDFLYKPFIEEEYQWRVLQNIELISNFQRLRDHAYRDFLTGLYNRNYFFGHVSKTFEKCKENNRPFLIAMLDIDHFKKINDTYGHSVGDRAIAHLAAILKEEFPDATLTRFGGEEFCVVLSPPDNTSPSPHDRFEAFRKRVEQSPVEASHNAISTITFTISIGLLTKPCNTLEDTISKADDLLYAAKNKGRNCTVTV